jgi:hypothetical protein
MFENRVVRRIFGPKGDGVTGGWRNPHTEELNYLHCSPNIAWAVKIENGMGGACSTYG